MKKNLVIIFTLFVLLTSFSILVFADEQKTITLKSSQTSTEYTLNEFTFDDNNNFVLIYDTQKLFYKVITYNPDEVSFNYIEAFKYSVFENKNQDESTISKLNIYLYYLDDSSLDSSFKENNPSNTFYLQTEYSLSGSGYYSPYLLGNSNYKNCDIIVNYDSYSKTEILKSSYYESSGDNTDNNNTNTNTGSNTNIDDNSTNTNTENTNISTNTSINTDILHNDLQVIISFICIFAVVVFIYIIYRFFSIFFPI